MPVVFEQIDKPVFQFDNNLPLFQIIDELNTTTY